MRSSYSQLRAPLTPTGGASTALEGLTSVPLLPTPGASDGSGGAQHPDKRKGHSRQLIDFALLMGSDEATSNTDGERREESGLPRNE